VPAASLLKDVTREELVRAVRVVARGDALLAPSITRRLIEDYTPAARRSVASTEHRAAHRTRTRDPAQLLAEGLTNADMAARLVVSEATVKTDVAHVLMKLGLLDRIQAVIFAYEAGLAGA
jgi:DNA-binding NarL/FixJ family response regulator